MNKRNGWNQYDQREANRNRFDHPPIPAYPLDQNGNSEANRYKHGGDYETERRRTNQHQNVHQRSHFGRGPKGWKRTDERIRDDVCERLADDPEVDASDIEVAVKDGVVRLSGKVESRATKRRAEDCLEGISGIHDVNNELSVDQSLFDEARAMITGDDSHSRH